MLRESIRVKAGRNKIPSASLIDSHSSKTALVSENVGFDGAKKVKGRKRHLAVDVLGLPLAILVHSAGIDERSGAKLLMAQMMLYFPGILKVWADGGYSGEKLKNWFLNICNCILKIVKRPRKRFQIVKWRWIVERPFGWLNWPSGVNRRLFQSVLVHGLFKVVTRQIVIQALNEQIKAYFEETITLDNVSKLKEAYEGMISGEVEMDQHLTCLKRLDISHEKKEDMIEQVCTQLSHTYKTNFEEHKTAFVGAMRNYLKPGSHGADFIQFQGPCSLHMILDKEEKPRVRTQVRFFRDAKTPVSDADTSPQLQPSKKN